MSHTRRKTEMELPFPASDNARFKSRTQHISCFGSIDLLDMETELLWSAGEKVPS